MGSGEANSWSCNFNLTDFVPDDAIEGPTTMGRLMAKVGLSGVFACWGIVYTRMRQCGNADDNFFS